MAMNDISNRAIRWGQILGYPEQKDEPQLADALTAALERLQLAVADSRKRYELQEVVSRRALLAICAMAAER